MVEIAKVVSLNKNMAKVQISGEGGCGSSCGSCKGCSAASATLVEAVNKVGAKIGQEVRVERNSSAYIKSIWLVFGLPLLMLFAGVILGYGISDKFGFNISEDVLGALLGITFWVVSYLIIRFIDKKFNLSGKIKYIVIEVI